MTRHVLKWPVQSDDQDHQIGTGRVVLVDSQGAHGTVCVWTEEEAGDDLATRPVRIYGTGNPVPEGAKHVGSTLAGPFVWHVFTTGVD